MTDQPPDALVAFMGEGWAAPRGAVPALAAVAPYYARRREAVSARFPDAWIVVPAGGLKVRANDTDYRFRPGSDFVWLTGHTDPDGVLVMTPVAGGHEATLYARELPDRSTREWFTDRRYSELWNGPALSLGEITATLGLATAPLDELDGALKRAAEGRVEIVAGVDPAIDARFEPHDGEGGVGKVLAELRLVKDDHEIACLEQAVAATVVAFEDVVRELPAAVATSERWVEGTFNRRARVEGNDVGYGTIVAAGPHACTLHWTRNDGPVGPDDLLLLDAGVEGPELYTADVTRTLPVSGRFSAEQREVYEVVWRAQRAGIDACRPGRSFLAPHDAAMRVITEWLVERGILSCTVDEALDPDRRLHQRYTLHGTSHMLGLDVHDCDQARREYREGTLEAGMVLTVEPGLYLRPDDLTVPERYRGIGVRIEDDVVVTADGCRVLSSALPTEPSAVETWMAGLLP